MTLSTTAGWFSALCLLAFLLPRPAMEDRDSRIAIRHDVPDSRYIALGERFPSAVRVGARGGSGTLVHPEWVVTAAHVAAGLYRRHGTDFQILFEGAAPAGVTQIVIHPEFQDMGPHDVALIRIDRAVEGVMPAALYRGRDEIGKEIVLVGHGDTKTGNGGSWQRDGQKRGATNIVDTVTRTHIVFDFDEPGEATELEGTAGPGDSGGPAFIVVNDQPHLAGVSSLGEPGTRGPGTYGAIEHYARVSSYADWFDDIMSNPPDAVVVNMPAERERDGGRVVRGGGGQQPGAPEGMIRLQEIGLLVAPRDGAVRMVGRIDQQYPSALLDAGIRPPAVVESLNGTGIKSTEELERLYRGIATGAEFTITFLHNGQRQSFTLTK